MFSKSFLSSLMRRGFFAQNTDKLLDSITIGERYIVPRAPNSPYLKSVIPYASISANPDALNCYSLLYLLINSPETQKYAQRQPGFIDNDQWHIGKIENEKIEICSKPNSVREPHDIQIPLALLPREAACVTPDGKIYFTSQSLRIHITKNYFQFIEDLDNWNMKKKNQGPNSSNFTMNSNTGHKNYLQSMRDLDEWRMSKKNQDPKSSNFTMDSETGPMIPVNPHDVF